MSVQVPAFTYLKSKIILLESIFSFFKEFLCKIFHFYQPYINFQILTNIFSFWLLILPTIATLTESIFTKVKSEEMEGFLKDAILNPFLHFRFNLILEVLSRVSRQEKNWFWFWIFSRTNWLSLEWIFICHSVVMTLLFKVILICVWRFIIILSISFL